MAMAVVVALSLLTRAAPAQILESGAWPSGGPGADVAETVVRFPSSNPFTPADAKAAPAQSAVGLFVRPTEMAEGPLPAVVFLHGAGGVLRAREVAYARQLARQGVAALVVDAFGPRRDLASSFTERLIHITETMLLADAYAALAWLAAQPGIDGARVALVGFSYGGMASVFAAYRQVAEALSADGLRFAAHVAFYGPCIARFREPRTTGAPILMLWGEQDAIVDPERCEEIAGDLRNGGSAVEIRRYPEAMHQWDGAATRPWRASRGLADCRLSVSRDGSVSDRRTHLPMLGPRTRTLILAACSDEDGYLIGRNDTVRALSNAALGRFLARAIGP